MKKLIGLIWIGFLLLLFAGCASSQKTIQQAPQTLDSKLDDLVNQIVFSLSQNQKTKIAVIEFSDIQGNITNLGKYLAEELTTRLYRTGKFEVVERQLMNKLIKEQELGISGFIDDNTAVSLGQILGVDAIASGSITDLGKSIKVNARLISTESGKVFSVASVKIPKDETIRMLLGQTFETLTTIKTETQIPTNSIVEKKGLKFELIEARMYGRTVICQVKITNPTEDDKDLIVRHMGRFNNKYENTKIYDDIGNENIVLEVKFANNKLIDIIQRGFLQKKIIAGTSVNMELRIEEVSSKATKITLLQIICGDYPGYKVEFRNIPIKKI